MRFDFVGGLPVPRRLFTPIHAFATHEGDAIQPGSNDTPSSESHAPSTALRDDAGLDYAARWRPTEIDRDEIRRFATEIDRSEIIATLLWARGVQDSTAAQHFLQPSLAGLADPDVIPDMDRAVDRIRAAIDGGERVCIYGDYDVDGLTSTSMLTELFRYLKVPVDTYVPDRLEEGYGLNPDAIRRIYARGAQLIITVDGGSNDLEELRLAVELGMDVIVTDHHPIHVELADVPIVHPGRPDERTVSADLAGVGVAYKLVWAVGRALSGDRRVDDAYRDFMLSSLMYVALGTVADVVPLTGENRILVHYGLLSFRSTAHPGILALLEEGRVRADSVAAENIAFRLAPLINAAGRLGAADRALDLLLSTDSEESSELASWLGNANRERKAIETAMLEESLEQIEQIEPDTGVDRTGVPLVVSKEGWHSGVAGIVAARLVDRYRRPVFVIAIRDGLGRGSARSLEGFPLTDFYDAGRPYTQSIGGHAQAGGMAIQPDQISLFVDAIRGAATRDGTASPASRFDIDLHLTDIDPALIRELSTLEPHGHANPTPRFRFDAMRIDGDLKLVGKTEEHLTFLVRQGKRRMRAIFFRGGSRARELSSLRNRVSIIAEVYLNDFRGTARPELRVLDFGPSQLT